MANVLVVEDSEFDFTLVKSALGLEHQVTWAKSISEAKSQFEANEYDLYILDVMLGGGSGLELCTYLRSNPASKNKPIIVLSAKGQTYDKVMGLNLGADDYLTKPFEAVELKARVERKMSAEASRATTDNTRMIGPLKLCLDTARAYLVNEGQERNADLTPTEFRILWTLSKRDGQLYSRDQLSDAAYGETHHITPRTIDSHIRSLRAKLGHYGEVVETVYGTGYRFNTNPLNKNPNTD